MYTYNGRSFIETDSIFMYIYVSINTLAVVLCRIWVEFYVKKKTVSEVYKDNNFTCSVPSPWRPHIEDKRMVLEYTHGLFIT